MKVEDFGKLTKAETGLIAHLRAGKPGVYSVSGSVPPENAPKDLHIRASLIRALALKQVEALTTVGKGEGKQMIFVPAQALDAFGDAFKMLKGRG